MKGRVLCESNKKRSATSTSAMSDSPFLGSLIPSSDLYRRFSSFDLDTGMISQICYETTARGEGRNASKTVTAYVLLCRPNLKVSAEEQTLAWSWAAFDTRLGIFVDIFLCFTLPDLVPLCTLRTSSEPRRCLPYRPARLMAPSGIHEHLGWDPSHCIALSMYAPDVSITHNRTSATLCPCL
jgi:hypothetical protein